jgi:hypothetical protein
LDVLKILDEELLQALVPFSPLLNVFLDVPMPRCRKFEFFKDLPSTRRYSTPIRAINSVADAADIVGIVGIVGRRQDELSVACLTVDEIAGLATGQRLPPRLMKQLACRNTVRWTVASRICAEICKLLPPLLPW